MDSFVQKTIQIIELLQKAAKDDTSEVASIAVCDGDHILMGKRRDNGRWTMPGGHLDKGEEKSDGAVRELFEESGIKVEPTDLKYLGSKDVVTHKGKKKLIHAFSYKHEGERPTTKNDPDKEVEKWEWIDCSKGIPKEVCENAHTPVDKNIVFEKMDLKPQEELSKSERDVKRHIQNTNPHIEDPSRNAMHHVPFHSYNWADKPVQVSVDHPKLKHSSAANKRDVNKYANMISKGSKPPAIVISDEGSHFAVHDGAHRLEAAKKAGLKHIDAYVGTPKIKKFESVQGAETQKEEPLFKPYRSEAQRRWAHTASGKKALGGNAGVSEWDAATKGKHLPEKVSKDDAGGMGGGTPEAAPSETSESSPQNIQDKLSVHPMWWGSLADKKTKKKKPQDLKKAPLPYSGFDQLAPEDTPNLQNPEDKKTTKKIKEVNLPNGLIYRQYTDQNPHKMEADEMDQRSGRRVHALFHPEHPTPLAIMETAHEHNALAPKGMYPHKVDVSEVDKDFRGKGLGRQLYLATLVHGTKQLTSDSRTSNDANSAWKSFRGLPGLGGKIGRSPKPGELLMRPGLADAYEEDRHQLHIKDPNALDHSKMFPKVDIFDKLAASEKKVDLSEIKRLLEAPEELETMDIPEHLQMQWSTPYHRWGR